MVGPRPQWLRVSPSPVSADVRAFVPGRPKNRVWLCEKIEVRDWKEGISGSKTKAKGQAEAKQGQAGQARRSGGRELGSLGRGKLSLSGRSLGR